MANFYVLVSHHSQDNGERDGFYFEKQLPDKHLSIGWGEINPFGKKSDKIKNDIILHYPRYKGTNNPDNGGKSLVLFCSLKQDDIVFIRGEAKILDTGIITGLPIYEHGNGHDNDFDYCTKVPFIPLFENKPLKKATIDIPKDIYNKILHDGGVKLVMRKINENIAHQLFKSILDY